MILCPSCGGPPGRTVTPRRDPWETTLPQTGVSLSFVCACGLLRYDREMDGWWLLVPDRCAMWAGGGRICLKEDGGVSQPVPFDALEEKISWMVVCAVVDS